ncbi:MAG: glycerophosphodiester phosphodiesterase [Dehalococcoidia bacterium]
MWALARGRPLVVPGRPAPALIAHATNSEARASSAIDAGADWVEVDIWGHSGAIEVRHERRTPVLPLLFEKWYVRFPGDTARRLAGILGALPPDVGVFFDLKDNHSATRDAIRSVFQDARGRRMAASSQLWHALRPLGAACEGLDLFYSVDSPAKLDLLLSVIRRDRQVAGVSARASLLQAPTVRALHDCGLQVVAWTVDDPDRAAELARWGVDGITTHVPRAIREALTPS